MSTVTKVTTVDWTMDLKKRRSAIVDFIVRLVKEKPLGTVGGIIVLIMFVTGVFADVLAPYGFNDIHLDDIFIRSSGQYWLGTDQLGRDILSRVIYGARISMIVGISVAFFSSVISALIGGVSGYVGGRFDLVMQRAVDAWMSFPGLVILLSVMSIIGPGLPQICIVLSFTYGISASRIIRSAVIAIKENLYVEAARAIGCSPARMFMRHILPNIIPVLIVSTTIRMAIVIITEATLSFLGFGIPPPMPSWGGMLSGAGRQYMMKAPWMAIWPGLALTISVYGINVFGDAARDLVDPRMRGGGGRYGGAAKKTIKQ